MTWLLTSVAVAVVIGAIYAVECWSWMRHGRSAVWKATTAVAGLVVAGVAAAAPAVVTVLVFGAIVWASVTGGDDVGLSSSADGDCDPNYSGACLDPNASDYDCAGGSGDGPEYVGMVTVTGTDVYGLDRDGDGIGCE